MLEVTAFERPRDYGEHFKARYGPTIAARANARSNGREAEFDQALDQFCDEWNRGSQTTRASSMEYLLAVGHARLSAGRQAQPRLAVGGLALRPRPGGATRARAVGDAPPQTRAERPAPEGSGAPAPGRAAGPARAGSRDAAWRTPSRPVAEALGIGVEPTAGQARGRLDATALALGDVGPAAVQPS